VPRHHDPAAAGDQTAAIRDAIRRIAEQRERMRIDAGRAIVTVEQVNHAVRTQRSQLRSARAEIEDAVASAQAAGERARAEAIETAQRSGASEVDAAALATAAAAPYEQTSRGLLRQREVIDLAAAQLEDAAAAAGEQAGRTRALLEASLRSLDTALREEVALLVQFERAERARMVARARNRLK
jgi:hypothetical protein